MKEILISNDDGYESPGLLALIEALRDLAHITVVAPSTEKSACGHSLTLTRPLSFISVGDDFYKLDDGTPSDCVYLALHSLFEERKPDLIISGINKGSNMGEDITYSGTAAAAMEGVLQGVPSIAISQVMDFTQPMGDFALASKAIRVLVEKIFAGDFPLNEREFLNVNVPYDIDTLEFAVTYAGYRYYANDAHLHRNPRGMEYYWLGLHPLEFKPRDNRKSLCDFEAIEQGMVSLTPVKLDMSAYKSMEKLRGWL
ncbi:5'/3'-nucleotidase SurE [Sulfuricurvum sp.]|uniref:5'/3'-nucleotidase SurE n=1 Tax=Sulfuricurvum sp. TaxID=2025608 RepID=UPI0035636E96